MKTYKIHKFVQDPKTGKWSPSGPALHTVLGAVAAKAVTLQVARADIGTCYAAIDANGKRFRWYIFELPKPKATPRPKVDPAPLIKIVLAPLLPTGTKGTDFSSHWAALETDFPDIHGFEFFLSPDGCFTTETCMADGVVNEVIPEGAEVHVNTMANAIAGRVNVALVKDPKLARAVAAWCKYVPTEFDRHTGEDATSRAVSLKVTFDDTGPALALRVHLSEPE